MECTRLSVYATRFIKARLDENLTLVIRATLAGIARAFIDTQPPRLKVGGLKLRPPPTKSVQTVADSAKTIFTEHIMKLITFRTLNAPAKAGNFYQ